MRKRKVKYTDEPIGEIKIVEDFLPRPENLAGFLTNLEKEVQSVFDEVGKIALQSICEHIDKE